jgi:glycosyltransferase involved in cell wall biosynthesis
MAIDAGSRPCVDLHHRAIVRAEYSDAMLVKRVRRWITHLSVPGTSIVRADERGEPTDFRFFLERHVGHRTYAENLLAVAHQRTDIVTHSIDISYELNERAWSIGRLQGLRGVLAGRREVRNGLRDYPTGIDVYNTQVPAALAGRALRQPYVVVTDVTPSQFDALADDYGKRPEELRLLRRWGRLRNERVFQGAALCVGWSKWAAASICADYHVDPRRVAVVPPGVDLGRWRPSETTNRERVEILFVGGEFGRKGGDLLVEVVQELPDWVHLTVVTNSDVKSSKQVTVIRDLLPNDDRLIQLFRDADLFVLPTIAETFGIAAVEASAAGLPVIASDIGGLSDIVIDGRTGILVPPRDGRALRQALDQIVGDSSMRRRMGEHAAAHATEQFDAVKNANRLIDLSMSACEEARVANQT